VGAKGDNRGVNVAGPYGGGGPGTGSGGGASDIRRANYANPNFDALAPCAFDFSCNIWQRIVVAGGGGGSGGQSYGGVAPDGGDGGRVGYPGVACNRAANGKTGDATPGLGATQAAGGAVGTGTQSGGYGSATGGGFFSGGTSDYAPGVSTGGGECLVARALPPQLMAAALPRRLVCSLLAPADPCQRCRSPGPHCPSFLSISLFPPPLRVQAAAAGTAAAPAASPTTFCLRSPRWAPLAAAAAPLTPRRGA